MNKTQLAFLGAVFLASPAAAADFEGRFAIEGAGRFTCEDFIQARADRDPQSLALLLGWLQGYFTAANVYEPETYDLMPWGPTALLEIIVGNYCEDNVEDGVYQAAQEAVAALREARLVVSSELIRTSDDADATILYADVLQRAQAALAERGLYKGDVDGAYGPQTAAALASFQEQEGLDPTGIPDPTTVWILLKPLGGQGAQ